MGCHECPIWKCGSTSCCLTCRWVLMKGSLSTWAAENRFCWFLCTKLKNKQNTAFINPAFNRQFPRRTPVHFLHESCRSGTYQILYARIFQVSYIWDKTVRFWQIRHFLQIQTFLTRFLQDETFSSKMFQDSDISCKILQDHTFSSQLFQDTYKNNALSSKILEMKSERFLQKMFGSSTGLIINN